MSVYADSHHWMFDEFECNRWIHPETFLRCWLCTNRVEVEEVSVPYFVVRDGGLKQLKGSGPGGMMGEWGMHKDEINLGARPLKECSEHLRAPRANVDFANGPAVAVADDDEEAWKCYADRYDLKRFRTNIPRLKWHYGHAGCVTVECQSPSPATVPRPPAHAPPPLPRYKQGFVVGCFDFEPAAVLPAREREKLEASAAKAATAHAAEDDNAVAAPPRPLPREVAPPPAPKRPPSADHPVDHKRAPHRHFDLDTSRLEALHDIESRAEAASEYKERR